MKDDTSRTPALTRALPLLRYAATAVAAGRVALGVVALTWPSVPGRPWVGDSADELGAQVFARALGARDVALGLGALAATWPLPSGPGPASAASAWYAAGALADVGDFTITAAAWPRLPRYTRWLIAAAAGGAAIAGAAGAVAVLLE